MNRWRVGEDRGSKEKDRCPLTIALGIEEAKVALTKVKDKHAMFYNR
jgi:hypothetical protein